MDPICTVLPRKHVVISHGKNCTTVHVGLEFMPTSMDSLTLKCMFLRTRLREIKDGGQIERKEAEFTQPLREKFSLLSKYNGNYAAGSANCPPTQKEASERR